MKRGLWIIALLTLAGPLGAQTYPCGAGARGLTYDEYAAEEYRSGAGHLDRARRFEAEIAGKTDSDELARGRKKIQRAYYNAKRHFDRALECDNRLTEAYTARGLALRKLGQLDASLDSYDAALALDPGNAESLLGRAEACLALERFDEVGDAYARLYDEHPESASDLLIAMQAWSRSQAAGNGSAVAEAFGDWVRGGARLPRND
jgi:tetratricopeptide (TPR) repeat protein